jgi:hypothetical protein
MNKKDELTMGRRKIEVTNLDEVLYPAAHFTKAQVIDYYVRASKFVLPHLRSRPVTLKRFPNGVRGDFFYEKDAPQRRMATHSRPPPGRSADVVSRQNHFLNASVIQKEGRPVALSGRTMEQIRAAGDAIWKSNRSPAA